MAMTTTTTAATDLQGDLRDRIAKRKAKYPELDNLDDLMRVFRRARVPWDAIARLLSDWAGTPVSGESLRRWYGSPEDFRRRRPNTGSRPLAVAEYHS